jgi:hypothetical protein
MIRGSRIMFIRTWMELIIRGTSGLSRALVALEMATSMAELKLRRR